MTLADSPGTASAVRHRQPAIRRTELPGEEWRPVPGWEDRYEVSSLGRVYRIKEKGFPSSGRILRPQILPTGYPMVQLWRDRVPLKITIHRLVMWAFVGPQEPGVVIRHLDGNPANNVLDNLKYGTPSENSYDRREHGTDHNVRKTHCPAGHPYSAENTYIQPSSGGRKCRTCKARRGREYEARKRGVA